MINLGLKSLSTRDVRQAQNIEVSISVCSIVHEWVRMDLDLRTVYTSSRTKVQNTNFISEGTNSPLLKFKKYT